MTDDQKRALEAAASAADRVAARHRPDCGVARLMREVGVAARAAAGRGPAQVATPAYRDHWETLFGERQPVGQA